MKRPSEPDTARPIALITFLLVGRLPLSVHLRLKAGYRSVTSKVA